MIRDLLGRNWYTFAFAALLSVIAVAGGFVVLVALPGIQQGSASGTLAPSAATPEPSLPVTAMSWLVMPADADCAACHLTQNGEIGLRPVPKIAHPLEGWSDCTSCHATDRLVATAPGHTGIHATACLTCHQPATLPPPLSRPHRENQNTACLDCHGSKAPLPSDMEHRSQTVCWLCHRLPADQPPVPAHGTQPGQTNCLTCHVAGKVGALPKDHLNRTVTECLLCHAKPTSAAPVALRFGLRAT